MFTIHRLIIVALILSGFWATRVAVAEPRLAIVIEDPDKDAIACGLQKSNLRSIAVRTLRNNRMQVVDAFVPSYLYIQLTALSSCAFFYHISVRHLPIESPKSYDGIRTRYEPALVLCEQSGILQIARGNTPRIHSAIEDNIKLCLGELVY